MLEKAPAHKELLVERGMSEQLIADITAAHGLAPQSVVFAFCNRGGKKYSKRNIQQTKYVGRDHRLHGQLSPN